MDFHSLTRRELQAFCKKNKIPANMTNAAMADALNALEIVEGIEEFIQTSQSETAESSIETLEGSEVTSPYVPPTAGRSTRRRNVVKEEPESVALTRTRRTARKTATKVSDESQVDTVETPAVVAQAGRRKVQMSTACRKMDSDLKDCVEEEKKDVSMTPAAPLGVASRRKVQMPYSTRRSVRLAGKSVQMVNDVASEGSELFKNEELTKDSEEGQEVNQKEGLNDCTGVEEAIAIVGENYENEVKSEAVEVQPDNTEYVSDEVQQSEVEENKEGKDIEIVASDSVEHVLLESKDNFAVDEVSHDEVFYDDAEQELHDGKYAISSEDVLVKLTELKLQQEDAQVAKMEGDCAEADSDLIDHLAVPEEITKTEPVEMETLQLEESKQSAVQEPNIEEEASETEPDEMETPQLEESKQSAVQEPNIKEEAGNALASVQNSPSKQLSCVEDAPLIAASTNIAEHIPNKSSAIKSMTDNKENNVIMNEIIKPAKDSGDDNLEEMSLRKLTKMFKEKLEITKKASKHGNEATLHRPALQVLPENRLIDGNEK